MDDQREEQPAAGYRSGYRYVTSLLAVAFGVAGVLRLVGVVGDQAALDLAVGALLVVGGAAMGLLWHRAGQDE